MIPSSDEIDEATRLVLNAALADAKTTRILMDAVTTNGKYRFVERFQRIERYHADDASHRKTAIYVDVETTGLDVANDAIIQLAIVPFEFSSDGRIFTVHECETWYEDPHRPIPVLITELTGISDSDVAGKTIDDNRIGELLKDAALVLAHNATFDRRMIERRLPAFETKYWACSREDVAWENEGFRSHSLEWLAYKQCQMYYDAHRAESDCYMAVHLLSTVLPKCGKRCLEMLLASARCKTARVWATGSDYGTRFVLKSRRYRWGDGANATPKAWWKDVPEDQLATEVAWLTEHVYEGLSCRAQVQRFDGRLRYSDRADKVALEPVPSSTPAEIKLC